MLIAEAAKVKDLDTLTWFQFSGPKAIKLGVDKQFNQKHPLRVQPGELVGLKKATRGPGAGNYQVVLGHATHVTFRNVPQKMLDKLEPYMKPFKGKLPEHGSLEEGQKRTRKIRIREATTGDKLTDDYYKPTGTVREHSTYDRENYQWRKVTAAGVGIKSLKQGRSKYTLQPDDIIGLRYMTKARGGMIILPNMQRVNIDHATYEQIVNGHSRILPSSKQQKGLVLMAEVKATLPKQTRIRKAKEKPEEKLIPRESPQSRITTRIGGDVKRHGVTDIPDVDFDDDEDDELENDIPDIEDDVPEIPVAHQPIAMLKVGTQIASTKRVDNRFIVVNAKEENGFTEFSLYSPTKKDVRKLRLSDDTDMSQYKSVQILSDKPSPADVAAGKRAYNKAVKDKKFTVGSIHDQ